MGWGRVKKGYCFCVSKTIRLLKKTSNTPNIRERDERRRKERGEERERERDEETDRQTAERDREMRSEMINSYRGR